MAPDRSLWFLLWGRLGDVGSGGAAGLQSISAPTDPPQKVLGCEEGAFLSSRGQDLVGIGASFPGAAITRLGIGCGRRMHHPAAAINLA